MSGCFGRVERAGINRSGGFLSDRRHLLPTRDSLAGQPSGQRDFMHAQTVSGGTLRQPLFGYPFSECHAQI